MTSQYGAYVLHALIRMHTPTRPSTNMHARRDKQVILLFHGNNDSRPRLSVNVSCLKLSALVYLLTRV